MYISILKLNIIYSIYITFLVEKGITYYDNASNSLDGVDIEMYDHKISSEKLNLHLLTQKEIKDAQEAIEKLSKHKEKMDDLDKNQESNEIQINHEMPNQAKLAYNSPIHKENIPTDLDVANNFGILTEEDEIERTNLISQDNVKQVNTAEKAAKDVEYIGYLNTIFYLHLSYHTHQEFHLHP